MEKIKKIDITDEFKICPTCGYRDGFHTMLKREKNSLNHLFICPSCHDIFDVGYCIDVMLTYSK